MLFIHLFINYVLKLKNIKYKFNTKYSNNELHYVKLTLGNVKNSTQKF